MESNLLTRGSDRLQMRGLDIATFYNSLSKQQIRELKVLIESTDFRFDIVGNLPIELIPLVFQHLELYQVFQSRRVSRRWLKLLGADEIVRPMLQPWIATEYIKLRIPEGLSSRSVLNIYAEHQDAFQTGNAFGRFQMGHGQVSRDDGATYYRFAYSDGILAWAGLTARSEVIFLRHLESGEERTFMPPERDAIDKIFLSQTLLVATTTSARCYIWAHQTLRAPFVLRTPSRCRNVFHLSKSSFILISIQPNSSVALAYQSIPVITWKLRDSWQLQPPEQPPQAIVSQFSIRIRSGFSVQGLYDVYVERQEHIILLESTIVKNKRAHTLRLLEFSFEGETLFEESLDCPFSENISMKAHESHPSQKGRFFDVWVVTDKLASFGSQNPLRSAFEETCIIYLRYYLDKKVCRIFDRKEIQHTHHAVKSEPRMEIWKGIAYCEEPRDIYKGEFQHHLRVMNFREETCVEAKCVASQRSLSASLDRARVFFCDEVFLVKITLRDIIVWCFDKHLCMAGEDREFKEERHLLQSRRPMNPTHMRCES